MRRILLLGAIFIGLSGTAGAHGFTAGRALLGARALAHAAADTRSQVAACPAGVPVQTITVVNQANVRTWALQKVENAMVAQSLQLRAAWGTPCVQFAAGGWMVYLRVGGYGSIPQHDAGPVAYVYTTGDTYVAWSQQFSHELLEMLENPTAGESVYAGETTVAVESSPAGPVGDAIEEVTYPVEVADPVEQRGYKLDGVYVSDFVFPAWFAGAPTVPEGGCDPSQNVPCGPPLAAPDTAGRYDEMSLLTGPWQATWGEIP